MLNQASATKRLKWLIKESNLVSEKAIVQESSCQHETQVVLSSGEG